MQEKKKLFDFINTTNKLKKNQLLNPKAKNYRNTFWMSAITHS